MQLNELPPIYLTQASCFDFLKEIPKNSVDLVLIDPPYAVSRDTNFKSRELTGTDVDRFRVSMDFGDWDKNFTGLKDVLAECYSILHSGGTIICFYDLWKISSLRKDLELAGFRQLRFLEWVKTNPVPLNSKVNYLTNAREIAVSGVKGSKPVFHSEYDNGIYSYPICRDKGRFHPTQKPLRLFMDLIQKHSNPGDLVLDCFAGSGTTALAAQKTQRRFIGCELNPDYHQKSIDRLEKANIFISKEG